MARKTTGKMLTELGLIAIKDCTCTEEQESGEDFSKCLQCEIGEVLNDIGERVQYAYNKFIKE